MHGALNSSRCAHSNSSSASLSFSPAAAAAVAAAAPTTSHVLCASCHDARPRSPAAFFTSRHPAASPLSSRRDPVLGIANVCRTMARAYVALLNSASSTTTTCLVSSNQDVTTVPATPSPPPPKPYNSAARSTGAFVYAKAKDSAAYRFARLPMPLEFSISSRAHWLSRVRSCLRLLIIVLSGAVVCMLMHTFEIYRGNHYIDLRKGELPMVWPAHTNLAPSIVLFCIAAANFLASVAILTLSFKRSFRRPFRSRDVYRVVAGSFGVITWITALVVFYLLNKASKASLGRYSCTNKNLLTNGRYQYRAVCEEQVTLPFCQAPHTASANPPLRELHSTPPLALPAPKFSPSSPSPSLQPSQRRAIKIHPQ